MKYLRLNHKPSCGRSVYGNRFFMIDKTSKKFEIVYSHAGWESPAQFIFGLGFGRLIIKCRKIKWLSCPTDLESPMPYTGVHRMMDYLVWCWRGESTHKTLPWAWKFIDSYIYTKSCDWAKSTRMTYERKKDVRLERIMYFDNGGKDSVTAFVTMEKRRWRMAWFPFIKKATRSIWCEFNEEIGKEKGSWKGGVVGAGTEMKRGESLDEAYERFFNTRRF